MIYSTKLRCGNLKSCPFPASVCKTLHKPSLNHVVFSVPIGAHPQIVHILHAILLSRLLNVQTHKLV